MNTFKTIAKTIITLIIIGGFASCEKTDVAPEAANSFKLTFESVYDSYEIHSGQDYSNYILYLPKDVDFNITMDVETAAGIDKVWWDIGKTYFIFDSYNSTESYAISAQPDFHRTAYYISEGDPIVYTLKSIWDVTTWPMDIITDNVPAAETKIRLWTLDGEYITMSIMVKTSTELSGLIQTP
ncbi:MAG: hypothetical protein GY751_25400 [Bacteroidetes bacterium]|nr:hypothetical protein [Bacteroidota bacterium]